LGDHPVEPFGGSYLQKATARFDPRERCSPTDFDNRGQFVLETILKRAAMSEHLHAVQFGDDPSREKGPAKKLEVRRKAIVGISLHLRQEFCQPLHGGLIGRWK
jgi:hypothetical protein